MRGPTEPAARPLAILLLGSRLTRHVLEPGRAPGETCRSRPARTLATPLLRARRRPPRSVRRACPALTAALGRGTYTPPAMTVTATPASKSTIELEIELPPERLQRQIQVSVGHLARRNRIPGFRPGKAPRHILERVVGPTAVLDDAVDHLVQDAYREAIVEQRILPLTNADVEILEAEE